MQHIGSYPSIFAIGHRAIADIFDGAVLVEEKIDGSQFSFARVDGELLCRSKGQQLIVLKPEKMFQTAVDVASGLDLTPGWVYRAEYLQTQKHNTLHYQRVPENHLALFDVQTGLEEYLSPEEKAEEAARLGIECVPVVHRGEVKTMDDFAEMLDRESALGGCKIEGVVVKNYSVFTHEKKVAIGKYVSEAFKETHAGAWKKSNPTRTDIVRAIIDDYRTEARWRKAVQHLRDDGVLEGSPRDIGKLIQEVPEDVLSDSENDIRDRLFKHFWPHIKRGLIAGFPEFYKRELAAGAFSRAEEPTGDKAPQRAE